MFKSSLSLTYPYPPPSLLHTAVTIGFERTEYSVMENVADVTVSVMISSGTLMDGETVGLEVVISDGMSSLSLVSKFCDVVIAFQGVQ